MGKPNICHHIKCESDIVTSVKQKMESSCHMRIQKKFLILYQFYEKKNFFSCGILFEIFK